VASNSAKHFMKSYTVSRQPVMADNGSRGTDDTMIGNKTVNNNKILG